MPEPGAVACDVVVVGCGPVGAAAANLLGRAGLRTLVLEKATGVVDVPRAIHFDASIMRVFQSVGLSDVIEPDCRVLSAMATYGARGQLLSTSTSGSGLDGWAEHYSFYQPVLEATLRAGMARFDNVEVRLGATVTDVRYAPGGVEVDWAESGRTRCARGRFVVAADGASSTVRKLTGLELEDLDFDEPWLVIDALVNGDHELPEATSQMFCDPARPTTVVPGPGRHHRWEFMLLPGEDPVAVAEPANIDKLLSRYVDLASTTVIRASVYRFHALVARRWRAGPVLLAGDAAHQTPPFLGQGMCHGIRDVQSIAWRLKEIIRGDATEELLDSYEDERKPQVTAVIRQAVVKGREICVLDPALAAERDRALAEGSPWGHALDSTMTLSVSAGLIHPSRARHAHPLPQPWVSRAGRQQPCRLDDLLPDGFFVLTDDPDLAQAVTDLPAPPVVLVVGPADTAHVTIEDPSGAVRAWLAGARAAVVRPDRHAYGFAANADELVRLWTDLRRHLTQALPARTAWPSGFANRR